ncbi:MAG TPA: hypothetical protein VKT77_23505 [Chthonomonadaceae bacterium]|nr:hypothetical protein [Chthonomonadaceae bacterium]
MPDLPIEIAGDTARIVFPPEVRRIALGTAHGDITLTVSEEGLAVHISGNLTLSATGSISLDSGMDLSARSAVNLNLQGTIATLEGTGETSVRGALVRIN